MLPEIFKFLNALNFKFQLISELIDDISNSDGPLELTPRHGQYTRRIWAERTHSSITFHVDPNNISHVSHTRLKSVFALHMRGPTLEII